MESNSSLLRHTLQYVLHNLSGHHPSHHSSPGSVQGRGHINLLLLLHHDATVAVLGPAIWDHQPREATAVTSAGAGAGLQVHVHCLVVGGAGHLGHAEVQGHGAPLLSVQDLVPEGEARPLPVPLQPRGSLPFPPAVPVLAALSPGAEPPESVQLPPVIPLALRLPRLPPDQSDESIDRMNQSEASIPDLLPPVNILCPPVQAPLRVVGHAQAQADPGVQGSPPDPV